MAENSKHLTSEQLDQEIQLFLTDIKQKLVSEEQTIDANLRATQALRGWHDKNLVAFVQEYPSSSFPEIEHLRATAPELAKKDRNVRAFNDYFSKLTGARPKIGIFNYFKAQALKEEYLERIKRYAPTMLDTAQKYATETREVLEMEHSLRLNCANLIAESYGRLVSASIAGNIDGFVDEAKMILSREVFPESTLSLLISTPVNGGPSPLETIFDKLGQNPNMEGELAGRLLSSFTSEHEAFTFSSRAENEFRSSDLKHRWMVYAQAYVGRYFPLLNNAVINPRHYSWAGYTDDDKNLHFRNEKNEGPDFGIGKNDASQILSALTRRPNYVAIGQSDVINVFGYSRIVYRDGSLKLFNGDTWFKAIKLDEATAKETMSKLAEMPHNLVISDKEILNAFSINRAGFEKGSLYFVQCLFDPDDRGRKTIPMDEAAAKKITLSLGKRPGFLAINDLNVMRGGAYCRMSYKDGILAAYDQHNEPVNPLTMNEMAAKEKLSALAALPGYVAIDEKNVLNFLNHRSAKYENGKLVFNTGATTGNPEFPMDEPTWKSLASKLVENGTHLAIGSNAIVNIRAFRLASYQDKKLSFFDSKNEGPEYAMEEGQAKELISTLGKLPSFMKLGATQAINTMGYARMKYEDEKLKFLDSDGTGVECAADKWDAKITLQTFRRAGQKPDVMQLGTCLPEKVGDALLRAAKWELTTQTPRESLPQILPLVITGWTLLPSKAASESRPGDPNLREGLDAASQEMLACATNYLDLPKEAFEQKVTGAADRFSAILHDTCARQGTLSTTGSDIHAHMDYFGNIPMGVDPRASRREPTPS